MKDINGKRAHLNFKTSYIKSLIGSLKNIFEALKQQNETMILIIDEMGKYLEFCSDESQDLHVFQELAENFTRSKCSSLLVGILHQSFGDIQES